MKLYGTPPSHFTRKVRVVLQELALPHDFIVLDRLLETGPEKFADNPLHRLPILVDGQKNIIESDIICEYLLSRYGSKNADLSFLPEGDLFDQKKRLSVMNGGMGAGAELMRGKRSGISWELPYFVQEKASLLAGLAWLNKDLGDRYFYGADKLSLLEISLQCFAEWATFREMVPSLADYPHLEKFVEFHRNRASFAQTHPGAEAKK